MISLFWILTLFGSCENKPAVPEVNPLVEHHRYRVGSSHIPVTTTTYLPKGKLLFLKLHDNETTAEEAATAVLKKTGGKLITIENSETRNVRFSIRNKDYVFDPNRIFSRHGITETLHRSGGYNPAAANAVQDFSRSILNKLDRNSHLITVHNNTDNKFSIHTYTTGELKRDAKLVYRNPGADPDDFVLTTDQRLFVFLRAEKINVVLQDNARVTNDGSLSYYYGKQKRFYVNVEAEHGHLEEQIMMIGKVIEFLNR